MYVKVTDADGKTVIDAFREFHERKQEILNMAHDVRSEKEMYSLVAALANGTLGP